MQIQAIRIGANPPERVNAIIEIAAASEPVKYEIDKDSGAVFVDRFVNVPMHYPCNYGFIPHTLSEDGDPLDILVITPVPVLTGSVVPCRTVGALEMSDESGRDVKLVAVPELGMNSGYDEVFQASDLPQNLLDQIAHFFKYYKKLEPEKWVKIGGWMTAEKAQQEIRASIARHEET